MTGPNSTDLLTACRGVLMGTANIVPGVSGGTVALVLGIYQRLLAAISHIDGTFVSHLLRGRWRSAAEHADVRFLSWLAVGVVGATVGLAAVMNHLLEHHREPTNAVFSGLILASGILVARMCHAKTPQAVGGCLAIGAAAAYAAYWIVSRDHVAGSSGLGYTFVCGMIAICAMILPGVSGSYLLIMLGKYQEITGIIKDGLKLDVTSHGLLTLLVFAIGCVVGLLAFSRFLKWLLEVCWTPTMAVLCGFMIGSLYKLWPFQKDLTPTVEKLKEKRFEHYLPSEFDGQVALCVVLAVAAFAAVLIIEAAGRRSSGAEAE